jgi:ornithine cyclodeaminase
VLEFLAHDGWAFSSVVVHDIAPGAAAAFASAGAVPTARAVASAEEVLGESDLVVVATTTSTPHLHDPGLFEARHTVLHLSLRDLAPAVVHPAQNFVDDIEHAFREGTSLQLAAESHGDRAFLAGTVADLIEGAVLPDQSRTRIFSPFGLGTLDLAVGSLVLRQAVEADRTHLISDFASGLGQG